MKKALSLILALVLLLGLVPMQVFAANVETPGASTANLSEIDLFVFAGQSNMMGASVLEPQVDHFTDQSLEYKYMPKLRGEETGAFVSAQNSAGEWYYNDLDAAYGNHLNDLSYKSTLSNYSANTYFCPAMSNGVKGFAAQSEADMYAGASLAPYFVTEYAEYGHSSIYAHMAKGSAKIIHYFTEEMMDAYNTLISVYNAANNKSYKQLSSSDITGAGDAFDAKYTAMVEDYSSYAPDQNIQNKCFVWLQGESDGGSYIEYKLKMQVLWEHLQELGFTHFFVLRVGYWGSTSILEIIKAQEDFCAENDNCYIVTRAPSLIPHPTATTENWWINEPDAQYADCRDSYVVPGSGNHHFNEKAMQIFAERSAENIHRILYQGLDPILEKENIQGMLKSEEDKPEVEQPEDTTHFTSYLGTEIFNKGISVSTSSGKWVEKSSSTAASTDLIPVTSSDSVWIQYVFYLSEAHAVGGFYDKDGNLVAPLYYKDFGFSLGGGGGTAAFQTPAVTNRILIADIESATGTEIAYVRFTAWQASAGGHANTEARIYHSYSAVVTAPTCTEQGYTTYTCDCGDSYVDDYVDATGEHTWGNWAELVAPTCDAEGTDRRICETCSEEQYRDTRITGDPNRILVSNPLTKDYFAGKRVLLIGDSITAGVGTTKTYGEYLAELLGVTVTNKGSSGSGYCSGGAMATNKNLTEANVRNADIIMIMLGVNDWNWAVKEGSWKGNPEYYDKSQTYYQLGDFNSTDTSTFYGALHAWCQKILAMQQIEGFEDKQFIVITPLITSWNVSVTSKKDWNQDKLNIHGHTFREYCTAIMEVCSYYDIPVFDANMFSGIYYRSAKDNNVAETGGDGVHVNAEGHALLAQSMVEFLMDGYSYETRAVADGGHTYVDGICEECRLPKPGPVITQQPESVEQEVGKKFAITVKAEGEGLTYQWYYKDAGMKNFAKSSNKTSSYAYTMQSYMHNRQVYCVITDSNGNSVQTETATITRPPQALKILEQPKDAQQEIGQKFSISPKVEGEGLTYQWYVKESGAKAFKVSSNKTSSYAYTMQNYMIGRQVYCVITDKYGNQVVTDVATISLPPVELKILTQPTDVSASLGEKFSISFEVQGDGLTYQWYVKEAGAKTFKVSSNKTFAYAYAMQSYMNGRQVYCVITDKYGNQVVTEVVTIWLNP